MEKELKINIEFLKMDLNEEDFKKYMNSKGFYCIKWKKNFRHKLTHLHNSLIEEQSEKWSEYNKLINQIKEIRFSIGNINNENKKGKPDFIIFNKDEFFFTEFKSKTDTLSIDQIRWFARNEHLKNNLKLVMCINSNTKNKNK